MGAGVKIIFLTTDDPLYLPTFFERVLKKYGGQTQTVYIVPPLYKGQTPLQAAWRYYRTFGREGLVGLAGGLLRVKIQRQSLAAVCNNHEVAYGLIRDVNEPEFLAHLRTMAPDVIVSVSCPQLFKKPLIELPSSGCLNVHGAILPHYRGIMPSFWMLANGEKLAGVSIYFMNEKIDAGDLCGQRIFDIFPNETLDGFLQRSKAIAAELLLEVLQKIENGTVTRQPLNLAEGSYYSWPNPDAAKRFRAAGRRLW